MMSPNLFYQDFLLCIGVASLIFGLFLLFFKAPANNIYNLTDVQRVFWRQAILS